MELGNYIVYSVPLMPFIKVIAMQNTFNCQAQSSVATENNCEKGTCSRFPFLRKIGPFVFHFQKRPFLLLKSGKGLCKKTFPISALWNLSISLSMQVSNIPMTWNLENSGGSRFPFCCPYSLLAEIDFWPLNSLHGRKKRGQSLCSPSMPHDFLKKCSTSSMFHVPKWLIWWAEPRTNFLSLSHFLEQCFTTW